MAVTAFAPDIADGWLTAQVGGSTAFAGELVTAQDSVTVPVNPPLGVIVTVPVEDAPGADMLTAAPLIENEGFDPPPPVDFTEYVQEMSFWLADNPPVPPVKPT